MSSATDGEPILEVQLAAPLRFDVSIGYWTGERDEAILRSALATVPVDAQVDRRLSEDGVRLCGPSEAVREQARLLREAGLE